MERFRIKALMALGLVALVALLAGCGGSSDSTTDSSSSFVADADGICTDLNTQIQDIPQPQAKADIAPYLDKTVPIISDNLDQLKALTPPSEDQDGFDTWIATLEEQQALAEKAQEEAADDPDAAIADLNKIDPLNTKGNAEAAALGLKVCSVDNPGGSSGGSSS